MTQCSEKDFEEWFKKFSSWGLTHWELVTASLSAPGSDPGDVVYTSPTGNKMTRHICSSWINFYSAAQAGWSAREKIADGELARTKEEQT